jgi:CheY-like chemotaxis protein
LAKRLVEMHGGSIGASSDGPARGSVFTVRLPRLAVWLEAAGTAPTRTAATNARRILLVEDSADVRRMLRAWLELLGHEVHETEDGITGLAQVRSLRPDVAVIDIGLPGLDGWELARQLRATNAGRRTMLIAVSGYGQAADQELSRMAGFDAHLVKPVDLDALTDIIQKGSPRYVGADEGAT